MCKYFIIMSEHVGAMPKPISTLVLVLDGVKGQNKIKIMKNSLK